MVPVNSPACRDVLRLVSLVAALPLLLGAALVAEVTKRLRLALRSSVIATRSNPRLGDPRLGSSTPLEASAHRNSEMARL
jgi:hypothetical protein